MAMEDEAMTTKTIVVPLDGSGTSERAIGVANALADRLGANVLLVTAEAGGPLQPNAYLEEKAAELRAAGRRVEVQVRAGQAVDAIIEAASAVDDAVVCMTTHGRGRLRWAVLGSTAEELLRRIDHPTVLVGRNCSDDFLVRSSRMIACVDCNDTSEALAPTAGEFASLLGLSVAVAMVVHPLDVESAEHESEMLDRLGKPFGESSQAVMLSNRYVAGAIADYADSFPAALVAMNTRGRHGLGRFALGSVTMGVVHLASCPVLVVHRDDDGTGVVETGAGS